MKAAFLLLSLLLSFSSFAKCDLQIPETKTRKVEKIFTISASCLGRVCTADKNLYTEALKEGYTSCFNIRKTTNGISGITHSERVTGTCYKNESISLSKSEKNQIACTRLLSCLSNGDLDNTSAIDIMKTFNFRCEL